MSGNHTMMSTHDLAVRPQNDGLPAGLVPIKRPVLHRIDHLVDLITVEGWFRLGGSHPFRRKLIRQLLRSGSSGSRKRAVSRCIRYPNSTLLSFMARSP